MKSITTIAVFIAILSSLGACAGQPNDVVARSDAGITTGTSDIETNREYRNPFLRSRHVGETSTERSQQSCVMQE